VLGIDSDFFGTKRSTLSSVNFVLCLLKSISGGSSSSSNASLFHALSSVGS